MRQVCVIVQFYAKTSAQVNARLLPNFSIQIDRRVNLNFANFEKFFAQKLQKLQKFAKVR